MRHAAATVMSSNIGGLLWCLVWVLCFCAVFTEVHGEAGWSLRWPKSPSHMHLHQVGSQRLLIKPCSPRYLLPDNCFISMWCMAPIWLLLTLTSSPPVLPCNYWYYNYYIYIKTNFSCAVSSDLLPASFLHFLLSQSALHTSTAGYSLRARQLAGAPHYQLPATVCYSSCNPTSAFPDGDSARSAQLPHDLFPRVINKSLLQLLQASVSAFGFSFYHPA